MRRCDSCLAQATISLLTIQSMREVETLALILVPCWSHARIQTTGMSRNYSRVTHWEYWKNHLNQRRATSLKKVLFRKIYSFSARMAKLGKLQGTRFSKVVWRHSSNTAKERLSQIPFFILKVDFCIRIRTAIACDILSNFNRTFGSSDANALPLCS